MNTVQKDFYEKGSGADLIVEEKGIIEKSRSRVGGEDWYGVALSGGGIRSAIFSLGALQALAAKNVLPSFDYISSVSGGGYISSALQWIWRNQATAGTTRDNFPFGAALTYRCGEAQKDSRLAYLRSHGQYLIPDDRLSIWSLAAVVIRTLFLNLMVWLPAGALAYLLLMMPFRFIKPSYVSQLPNLLSFVIPARWIDGSCTGDVVQRCQSARAAALAKSAAKLPDAANACTAAANAALDATQPQCGWTYDLFFDLCLWAALLWIVGFGFWAVAFSLDTRISPKSDRTATGNLRTVCGGIAFFAALASAGLIYLYYSQRFGDVGITGFSAGFMLLSVSILAGVLYVLQEPGRLASANYLWRRTFEVYAGKSFPWIVILIALGTVPVLPYFFLSKAGFAAKAAASVVSVVSGLYAAIFGHRAQTDQSAPEDVSRWVLMVASAIFIYSIAVVSYVLAQIWLEPEVLLPASSLEQNLARSVIMIWVPIALVLMFGTNTNYVGLHRFYRDRLMEAFMPDHEAVRKNEIDFSPGADQFSLTDLWPPTGAAQEKRDVPYPIINANAIFMNDKDRLVAWRGGDNFILSPTFVGSSATGWERTSRHIRKHGPLSVPTAMAASGAAMNANAAYVGAGVTRDRLVSIVLMLLNLRLGVWAARPDEQAETGRIREPNHWSPGFRYGMTRSGYTSESPFVELTDGGHFDNSGIYELARRRCVVIVAIDGEEDPNLALPALYSVAQRVREDFKTTIELDGVLDELIPAEGKGYPEGVSFVTRPYFVARIFYPPIEGTQTGGQPPGNPPAGDGGADKPAFGTPPGDDKAAAEQTVGVSVGNTQSAAASQASEARATDAQPTNNGPQTGVLIYVKLSLAQGLGFDALGYRAQHSDFPHQPTVDQFFVPEQVEAYRTVGFVNMQKALEELGLQQGPISIDSIVAAYANRPRPSPDAAVQPSPR